MSDYHRTVAPPDPPPEARVKEKSSYKKLISNMQATYPDLSQEEALKGILALRVQNNGTLTGMTMLEIMERVIQFVKDSNHKKETIKSATSKSSSITSDDYGDDEADEDVPNVSKQFSKNKVTVNESNGSERNTDDDTESESSTDNIQSLIESLPKRQELPRERKTVLPLTQAQDSSDNDERGDSDDSYDPEKQKKVPRKKFSPRKKENEGQFEKTPPKPRAPRKKAEKVELSIEDIEAEFPKTCRKRKIPSYFREFALPEPEAEEPNYNGDDKIFSQKYRQKSKEEKDVSINNLHKAEKRKTDYRDLGVQSSMLSKKIKSSHQSDSKQNDDGECIMCGLVLEDGMNKFSLTDKTRETGVTFGRLLSQLLRVETVPASLGNWAASTDLNTDQAYLCTLCVSHIDQLDVFQQKVNEIQSSILKIFTQNRNLHLETNGNLETESESDRENKNEQVTPKKRGRKPKIKESKIVTLMYQSPLKKVADLQTMTQRDLLGPSATHCPVVGEEEGEDLVQKLRVLSGIEIKRVNTETGEESDAALEIRGLGAIEIKKIGAEAKEKKKRKPYKKRTPKIEKLATTQISPEKFENACEELQNELEPQSAPLQNVDASVQDRPSTPPLPGSARPVPPSLPAAPLVRPGGVGRGSAGRGRPPGIAARGRGGPRGPGIRPLFRPSPPKSKKSLFELSQNKRRVSPNSRPPNGAGTVGPPSTPTPPVTPAATTQLGYTQYVPKLETSRKLPVAGQATTASFCVTSSAADSSVDITPAVPAAPASLPQSALSPIHFQVPGLQVTSTPLAALSPASTPSTNLNIPSLLESIGAIAPQKSLTPKPPQTPQPSQTSQPSQTPQPSQSPQTPQPSQTPQAPQPSQPPQTPETSQPPQTQPSLTAAEVKQKKAYRKLVGKIQSVHPDMTTAEAEQGIFAVRAANNGKLTGMSMQEIIAKVRASVMAQDELTLIKNELSNPNSSTEENVKEPLHSISVQQSHLFEIKCKFCSRLFKSASETATRKVYEIHIKDHENETRDIYEKEKFSGTDGTDDAEIAEPEYHEEEKENVPDERFAEIAEHEYHEEEKENVPDERSNPILDLSSGIQQETEMESLKNDISEGSTTPQNLVSVHQAPEIKSDTQIKSADSEEIKKEIDAEKSQEPAKEEKMQPEITEDKTVEEYEPEPQPAKLIYSAEQYSNSVTVKKKSLFELSQKRKMAAALNSVNTEKLTVESQQIEKKETNLRTQITEQKKMSEPKTEEIISNLRGLSGIEVTKLCTEPGEEKFKSLETAEKVKNPEMLNPDPVRSEISYCKLCQKQFKNAKAYGLHQNTEHAAEKEFEKISFI